MGPRCRQCTKPLTWMQRDYCSRVCFAAARSTKREYPCTECGKPVIKKLSTAARRINLFCSRGCYAASLRGHPPVVAGRRTPRPPCARCGTPIKAGKQFCSRSCFALARARRIERLCRRCGNLVSITPSRLAAGRGRYCSDSCHRLGRRTQVERVCERCSKRFWIPPSQLKYRPARFCGTECAAAASIKPRVPVRCQAPGCGRVRQVTERRIASGREKFCSLGCYRRSLAAKRLTISCAQCRRRMAVAPSGASRRFCRWRCYRLATAPRTFTCLQCPREFESRLWRDKRFCSLSCANRRRRERSPEDEARIRYVLELHAEGMKAPAIQTALRAKPWSWWVTAAAVRQVISRETRAAAAV
jgi:predicted nucleic acid-binding Zn ribbon protein